MTIPEALEELRRKAEPGALPCLRCTAMVRRYLIEMAASPVMGAGWDLADDDIRAEVDAIFAAHPELATRFQPNGVPIGIRCPEPAD